MLKKVALFTLFLPIGLLFFYRNDGLVIFKNYQEPCSFTVPYGILDSPKIVGKQKTKSVNSYGVLYKKTDMA